MIKTLSSTGATEEASAEAQRVLTHVQEEWNRAAKTWDIDGLTAMYTPDAVMYGGRPGMSMGLAGMRGYFSSYGDLLVSTHLELRDQIVIELAPDTYLAQGYGDFSFLLTSGKRTGTTLRTTLVIVRRKRQWKILQHHFSSMPDAPPIPQ